MGGIINPYKFSAAEPGGDFFVIADRDSSDSIYYVDASNPDTYSNCRLFQETSEPTANPVGNLRFHAVVTVGYYGSDNVYTIFPDGTYTQLTNVAAGDPGISGDHLGTPDAWILRQWSTSYNQATIVDGTSPSWAYSSWTFPSTAQYWHMVGDKNNTDNLFAAQWGGSSAIYYSNNGGTDWNDSGYTKLYQHYMSGRYNLFSIGRSNVGNYKYYINGTEYTRSSTGFRSAGCAHPDYDYLLVLENKTDNIIKKITTSGLSDVTVTGKGTSTDRTINQCRGNADIWVLSSVEGTSTYLYVTTDAGSTWTKSPAISSTTVNNAMPTRSGKYVIYPVPSTTEVKILDIGSNTFGTSFFCEANVYSFRTF